MKSSKRTTAAKTASDTAAANVGASGRSWRWEYWALAMLAALALFEAYGPALRGPFLFDDVYLPFLVPNFADQPFRDWITGVRPMLQATYWLNYRLFGLDPYPYHLMNLLFHAAAGFFSWLIARKLLELAVVSKERSRVLAAFVTGVFLFHPLQTEPVSYVASRSEVLSGMFMLAAWAAFLYRKKNAIGWAESATVTLLFLFAITSKEHAAAMPAILLLTDYFFHPGFTLEGIRRNWRLYAPLLVGAAAGAAVIFRVVLGRATTAGFGMKDLSPLDYLFTQFRSVVTYLRLYFFPIGLNVDHDVPISRSLADELSWLYLLILLALTGAAWFYRKRFPLASFGFLLFLVLLAPTSSFVPIRDVLVERRMYLPVFAVTLCVVEALRHWRTGAVRLGAFAAAIVLVLGVLNWQRNHVWANPENLWRATVKESPRKYRPRFQLAYALYQQGECLEANTQFAEAAKLGKPDYELLVDWALAADCANRPGEALTHLESALRLENNAHAWALVGMVRGKQQDYERALEALRQAEALQPRFSTIFVYRGNIHMARKEWDLAIEGYEKALAIDPNEPSSLQNLGTARAEKLKAQAAR